MEEIVVWAAAGKMAGEEPVENQRFRRCKALWRPRIEVTGDLKFRIWRAELPPDTTILLLYDFKKKWKLIEYVDDDPSTRVMPLEEEVERRADVEEGNRRHQLLKSEQSRKWKREGWETMKRERSE